MIYTIVLSFIWFGLTFLNPHELFIPSGDSLSSFPFKKHTRVPQLILSLISFPMVWLIMLGFHCLQRRFDYFFNAFSLWSAIWIHIDSIVSANIICQMISYFVGRARPDFFSRCGRSSTPSTCTVLSKDEMRDELRSFPCSDSATVMAGLLFCAFFVQKVFKSPKTYVNILSIMIFTVACGMGVTRICSYRSHPDDVIGGFLVGAISSYIFWKGSKNEIFRKKSTDEVPYTPISQ